MPIPAHLSPSARGPQLFSTSKTGYTQSRLRICTAQEEISPHHEQQSPPTSPEEFLTPRHRPIPRAGKQMSVREAVHGALGSAAPVELLPGNSKAKSDSRRSSNAGGSAPEIASEPALSPPISEDENLATDGVETETKLPHEPVWSPDNDTE